MLTICVQLKVDARTRVRRTWRLNKRTPLQQQATGYRSFRRCRASHDIHTSCFGESSDASALLKSRSALTSIVENVIWINLLSIMRFLVLYSQGQSKLKRLSSPSIGGAPDISDSLARYCIMRVLFLNMNSFALLAIWKTWAVHVVVVRSKSHSNQLRKSSIHEKNHLSLLLNCSP